MYDKETRLFNSEQKQNYFKSIPNCSRNLRLRFEMFANKIEKPLQKDLSEMSYDEMIMGLSNLNYMTYNSVRVDKSFISNYITWLQQNKLIYNTNNIADIIKPYDVNISKTIRNSLFKDYNTMIDFLDTNCLFLGNELSTLCCLVWLGLSLEEILDLKNEDVDLENGIAGKINDIPKEILKVLKTYNETESYDIEKSGIMTFIKKDVGYFFKKFTTVNSARDPMYTKDQLSSYLRRFVTNYNKANGTSITIGVNSLHLSGNLFRLYQIELLKGSVEDSDIKSEFNINSITKYEEKFTIKDYRQLYEVYKSVFWN